MISLLNRLAWFVSIFSTFIFFIIILGDEEEALLFTLFAAPVFKLLIFSKAGITRAVGMMGLKGEGEVAESYTNEEESVFAQEKKKEISFEELNKDIPEEETLSGNIQKIKRVLSSSEQNLPRQEKSLPHTSSTSKIQKPKEPNIFQKFFAENLIAKVGGILLFLGVLFLLQLVYSYIGPVGKIIIGFAIGFTVYGVGIFLEKKNFENESRTLMGTGILINFLVILAGRYLIGDTFSSSGILSEGITFLLLLCNTLFAVLTALAYASRAILFFGFIAAYLNPFLIGSPAMDAPYTLVGYGAIISAGGIILAMLLKNDIRYLLFTCLLGGSALFLVAPFDSSIEWIVKLVALVLLWLSGIFYAARKEPKNIVEILMGLGYVFLILMISVGQIVLSDAFHGGIIVFSYLLSLVAFMGLTLLLFLGSLVINTLILLFIPLGVIFWLLITGGIAAAIAPLLILGSTLFLFFLFFAFLKNSMTPFLHIVFFVGIGLFLLLGNVFLALPSLLYSLGSLVDTPLLMSVSLASIFIFYISSLFLSVQKGFLQLYSIGSIATIFAMLPLLTITGALMPLSATAAIAFLVLNIGIIFFQKNFFSEGMLPPIIGLVAGALFGTGEIYLFGMEYFSGVTTGAAFLAFAILYFLVGYSLFSFSSASKKSEESTNIIYSILGVSISLFSLAIAFVFSKHSEIVSAVWLFEASVLYFFYEKTKNKKVFGAAVILMIIGVLKLAELTTLLSRGDFVSLIPLSVILGSLMVNLHFLKKENEETRIIHDILHLIAVGILGILLLIIIPDLGLGWSSLGVAGGLFLLAFLYGNISSGKLIGTVFTITLSIASVLHIVVVADLLPHFQYTDKSIYTLIQYAATAILFVAAFMAKKTKVDAKGLSLSVVSLYLFIVTTQYVYYLFFQNTFIVTIYWGVLAFLFSGYGIQKDVIKYRTIGMFILILTVAKILIYDIWIGLDDAVMRIIALMGVGALMITISVLYSKKYGNDIKEELSLKNIFSDQNR